MYLIKKMSALLTMLVFTFVVGCASTETSQTENTTTEAPKTEQTKDNQKEVKQEVVDSENVDAPGNKYNLPPKIALNQFTNVEVEPVTMSSPNADSRAGKRARRAIDGELRNSLPAFYQEWKTAGAVPTKSTLLVRTDVPKIKIVPPGARFWGGAFAGRSSILIKMTLVDKETNQVIGASEFYRHSNAFAATWSGGAADRDIVSRATQLIFDYFEDNGKTTVKTPTGR